MRVVRDVLGQVRGLRMPGAGVPGRVAIGTWRGHADGRPFHDFVLVRTPGPGVVITTAGDYDRILLGSEDPEQLAAELGAERARASAGRPPTGSAGAGWTAAACATRSTHASRPS